MVAREGGAYDAPGPIPEVGLMWGRERAGRPGCGKCGGPAPCLGTAEVDTAAAAAAVGDWRGYAGERRSFPAERWRLWEKVVGLRPERGRAGEGGRSRAPTVERRKDGRGTEASAGPAKAQAREAPGRAGDAGRTGGVWEVEVTALRAGGRSALPLPEGQVLLARSCYLHPSWGHEAWAGPPAVRIRAAAEGREARRGAGKSPAPPAVGRWGRDLLPPARVSALGGYSPPFNELFCDFPPTSPPKDGKVCKAGVRKSPLFWVGVL